MIGDKLEHNGKEYIIQRDITFGEYTKWSILQQKLTDLGKQYGENPESVKDLPADKLMQLASTVTETQGNYAILMVNALNSILGVTQEELDRMPFVDGMALFQKMWNACTAVKKKSEQPYG